MTCDHKHTKEFVLGALAGGIVGAVVGLLLAPKAGEELRHDLVEKCEEMSGKTHAFAKSSKSKANKWLHLAREMVDDLTEEAHDKGEDVLERASEFIKRSRLHDVMEWAALGVRLWEKSKKSKS